jgi:hypothetical protein
VQRLVRACIPLKTGRRIVNVTLAGPPSPFDGQSMSYGGKTPGTALQSAFEHRIAVEARVMVPLSPAPIAPAITC